MKLNVGKLFRVVAVNAVLVSFFALAVSAQKQKAPDKKTEDASQAAAVKFQPLNIKPGLWESTRTISRAGEMPIPAEMLNRLTPEQRAKMEARMKANAAANSHTSTDKNCVTREDIQDEELKFAKPDANCTRTILSSSSTSVKGQLSCDAEGMKGGGILELEAPDPEHVKGSWHGTMTGNGHTMNVDATFSSKWLGSSCEK